MNTQSSTGGIKRLQQAMRVFLADSVLYFFLVSICLRLVGVWVVFQELSYVSHDGLLVGFVHIHICKKNTESSKIWTDQK